MNSKENRFLLDSKYQLALQHATIPISIFGFNTLDEDEWRNNTLEYMTTPILNKRKPTSIGKELTETNTSELRRIRGLPSSLRAIIPSENQKLIVETIVSNEPRKQGLKSSQYYRNNRDGDALYDIPNSARRYYTEPDPEESPPKRASSARNSRRMNDSQKVDSQSKVNNNPRTVRATNSPERKDLTTPKSPIPIRRGVDGSPLFMTPIKKTKLVLNFFSTLKLFPTCSSFFFRRWNRSFKRVCGRDKSKRKGKSFSIETHTSLTIREMNACMTIVVT